MPWQRVELMEQRRALVEQLLLPNANVNDVCQKFNVSRKTAYKWLNRYRKDSNLSSLKSRSTARKNQPQQASPEVEEKIISAHMTYPCWGPRKLKAFLANTSPEITWPSSTTFHRVLKRNNCHVITSQKSKPATKRFEREHPNSLWQMDFKGSFMTEVERCYPLTILDDFSRHSIELSACKNEQYMTVKHYLSSCFERYGLPDQINVDNGNPWGLSSGYGKSKLFIWLIKCGVRMSYSAPFHPQTNGKDERFHRTLKLEVLHNTLYKSCRDIQKAFDDWQHTYNHIRPHDALSGQPPSSRYQPSKRKFTGQLLEPNYDADTIVRRPCRNNGLFGFKGKRYRAGKGLGGELIGLKETAEPGVLSLFFMDTLIKKINLKDGA